MLARNAEAAAKQVRTCRTGDESRGGRQGGGEAGRGGGREGGRQGGRETGRQGGREGGRGGGREGERAGGRGGAVLSRPFHCPHLCKPSECWDE